MPRNKLFINTGKRERKKSAVAFLHEILELGYARIFSEAAIFSHKNYFNN
jgi:hypothetical protein